MKALKQRLSVKMTSKDIELLVHEVGDRPEMFPELYVLMDDEDEKVSFRAVWACEKLGEVHPEWFAPRYDDLVEKLLHTPFEGNRRVLLAILYNLPVRLPVSVPLLNFCFAHGFAPQESVGVQALSIRMAHKLCLHEPALLPELKALLDTADLDAYSKGVQATIRGVLKKL